MSLVSLRIATYNIHKCRGMDRRVLPSRIAEVLHELDADLIALQEVHSLNHDEPSNQARFLARQLPGYAWHFGENRLLRGGPYGNMTLSRRPVSLAHNYDLTWGNRERRGCLRTDIELPGVTLHFFNTHLGTGFIERRHQARRLLGPEVLQLQELLGPRIIVGDFNEWTRGLASRLMGEHFESVDLRRFLRHRRTYPGLLPLLHLDHFYYDRELELTRFHVHRSRSAFIASDHLPLVADFQWPSDAAVHAT